MPRDARWLAPSLGLILGGACVESGLVLEAELEDGLTAMVEVREGRVLRWQSTRRGFSPFAVEDGGDLYLVHVPDRVLEGVRGGVDPARLSESSVELASPELAECAPLRFHRGEGGESLEVGLREAAQVYVRDGGRLLPAAMWPAALDALSLRVPTRPCRTRPARLQPFVGEPGPLLRAGDQLGARILSDREAEQVRLILVAHLDEDYLVVGLPSALLVIARGENRPYTRVLDLTVPSEIFGGDPVARVSVMLLQARSLPPDPGQDGLRLVMVLAEHRPGTELQRGIRVVEVGVSAAGFGGPRLVHRADHPHESFAAISADREGRFVVAGLRWLDAGRLDGSVVPHGRTDVGAHSVLLSEGSEPALIVGERPMAWLEGDPGNPSAMTRVRPPSPPRTNTSYVSVLRRLGGGATARVFSGTSDGTLFERGATGWRLAHLWYPEELPGRCATADEVCGRRGVQGLATMRSLVFRPNGELVFVLRYCKGIFLLHPERLGCAEQLQGPFEDYANDAARDVTFNDLSLMGDRLVLAGDAGLLAEVVLD